MAVDTNPIAFSINVDDDDKSRLSWTPHKASLSLLTHESCTVQVANYTRCRYQNRKLQSMDLEHGEDSALCMKSKSRGEIDYETERCW